MATSTIDTLAAKNQENTDAALAALNGFTAQLNEVSSTLQKTAVEAGEAKAASVVADRLATKKAQEATLKQASTLGTNPDAASFALDKLAVQYEQNNARAQKFADNVAYAMDPTNITDNPFKYVGQLLLLDLNKEGQASAERASSRTREQYMGLNQMTQQYGQTQLAIAQTVTTETIAGDAKVAAFEFAKQAAGAQLDQLRANSDMVMKALQLKNSAFDIERARQASENDAERMRMAREQAKQSNVEMSFRIAAAKRAEAREKRLEDKAREAEEVEQATLQVINSGASALGVPIQFASTKELQLALKSKDYQDKIENLYQVGLQSVFASRSGKEAPQLLISDSPTKTLELVAGMGAQLSTGQQPIVELIKTANSSMAANPEVVKMKKAEYTATLDKTVKEVAAAQYKNIGKGENNIYAAPPMSVYLANTEFVTGAPATAAFFKTTSELGKTGVDFKELTSNLIKQAKDGKMTLEQVDSELKFLSRKTMDINNSLRRYDGTAGLPRMTNVNVEVSAAQSNYDLAAKAVPLVGFPTTLMGAFGDTTTRVDLADDTKRRAYLNQKYSDNLPTVFRQEILKTQGKK